MNKKFATHILLKDALNGGPPPTGNLAIPLFEYGSMEVEIYTPLIEDTQTPHLKDEIYIVTTGSSTFFNGEEYIEVKEGSFIFVPAGTIHRFVNFTEGFTVWVIFYGPIG
ncbi:MAG: cupin domain-containing protein, partial [Romboutsia sp.]|nr:cupin domain-containing protein [Romboutsia sp.]